MYIHSFANWFRQLLLNVPKRALLAKRLRATRKYASRRSFFELLETRAVLTSDWQNPLWKLDVDFDGTVSQLDALVPINAINSQSGSEPGFDFTKPVDGNNYLDVDGDQMLSPLDVLTVINFLNTNTPRIPTDLALSVDTGSSNTDKITNNSSVSGAFTNTSSSRPIIKARLDRGVVVPLEMTSNNTFVFVPSGETPVLDGVKFATVFVDTNDGRIGYQRLEFTLDTTAPSLSAFGIDPGDDSGRSNADGITRIKQPKVSLKTDPNTNLRVSVDSSLLFDGITPGTFLQATTTLTEGTHQLTASLTDIAGNVRHETRTIKIDTTAPEMGNFDLSASSDSGVAGDKTTRFSRVTLQGTTEENSFFSFVGSANAFRATGDGSLIIPGVALNVGNNNFVFNITDLAGNTNSGNQTFSVVNETASSDAVLTWNQAILDAIQRDATTPPIATRGMAMMSIAMLDTLNAIEKTPSYLVSIPAPANVSTEAAMSTAAYEVLKYLYPAQQQTLDAVQTNILNGISNASAKANGVAFGTLVADAVIALRKQDGWYRFVDYTPSNSVGQWQLTGPMFEQAQLPQWADLRPFAVSDIAAIIPSGLPSLSSTTWSTALNEVKSLGSATSTSRTADQTQQARFWADGAGTATPPGHWNQIASQIAATKNLSLSENARLFATLNIAMSDSSIAAWKTKYAEEFWRPITAIRQADTDSNSATTIDPNWSPLLITPPHPEYVSGHSTYSAAAARILSNYFGDNQSFTTASLGLANVTRSYTSFTQAAAEAGRSRIYGGIHYEFSNQDGQALGRSVADKVIERFALSDDLIAPSIVFVPPTTTITSTNPTIEGLITDNLSGVARATVQVDNGPVLPLSLSANGRFAFTPTLPLNSLANGNHTVRFIAIDKAGLQSSNHDFTFTLDTLAPTINVTSPADGSTITANELLRGTISGTGSNLVSLSYQVGTGPRNPISFSPGGSSFTSAIDLSKIQPGSHTLSITTRDSAGLETIAIRSFVMDELIPLTITGNSPSNGSSDIGSTFRPQVHFSRPINTSSLTPQSFFAIDTTGIKLPATIVPAQDGTFAWLFFTNPMPGSSTITVHVDGDFIIGIDGKLLDADGDGTAGGKFTYSFTTVSLSPLTNTTFKGRVVDPGIDLKAMTRDDILAGPDGILHTSDDVFLNPIAGAKVFVLGREGQSVTTDAQGFFEFASVPSGTIKLAVDGRTATNAPAGVFWPEMVMDLELVVGSVNTAMGTMGTREERVANLARTEIYLPRLQTSILKPISNTTTTTIGVDSNSSPNLTSEQRNNLRLEVVPNSILGENGRPLTNAQIGISTVPPELVRDMLPPGLLQHTFDITIQAPNAATFSTPLQMTFPNVFNAEPGTKLSFLSFDHTTGRLVIEGTATVSDDGLSATTDPGSGITKPGWHGLTPPGGCGGSGGPPPRYPSQPNPKDTEHEAEPRVLPLITGESGSFPLQGWSAPDRLPDSPQIPPPPPAGCGSPPPRPQDRKQQPYLKVTIEVDGPLSEFMEKAGGDFLNLQSDSFHLTAGSNITKKFAAQAKSFSNLFPSPGIDGLEDNILYGSKVKITEIVGRPDGSKHTEIRTFYLYRFVDSTDSNHDDATISFEDAIAGAGISRKRDIQIRTGAQSIPNLVPNGSPDFRLSGPANPVRVTFTPTTTVQSVGQIQLTTESGKPVTGTIKLQGRGVLKQKINLNQQELTAVLNAFSMNFESSMSQWVEREQQAYSPELIAHLKTVFRSAIDPENGIAFSRAVLRRVQSLFNGFEVEFSEGNSSTLTNYIAMPPRITLYGESDYVDLNISNVSRLFRSGVSRQQLGYELDSRLNMSAEGIVEIYLASHIGRYLVSSVNPIDALVNNLADTIAHEIGHTFGLYHPFDFQQNGRDNQSHPDVMSYARDDNGRLTFSSEYSAPTLRIALNGVWNENDIDIAMSNFFRKISGASKSENGETDGADDSWQTPLDPLLLVTKQGFQPLWSGFFDFLEVELGSKTTKKLLLSNMGTADLIIDGLRIVGDEAFKVQEQQNSIVIRKGETVELPIDFLPIKTGRSDARLTIVTKDGINTTEIALTGLSLATFASMSIEVIANNLGGVTIEETSPQFEVAKITNFGKQPLTVSEVRVSEGSGVSLLNVDDINRNPLILAPGSSYTLIALQTADSLGLNRATISISSNDPTSPKQVIGLVSTGLGSIVYPEWGEDYIAIDFPDSGNGNRVLRAISDSSGNFDFFLPPSQPYHITIFDPVTGLVSHGYGTTPPSGEGIDLTSTLVFEASTASDSDSDGLPDDIEFAIGTSSSNADTNEDGISDFTSIQQGLDPLAGKALVTGIVSRLPLLGEANQIVVQSDINDIEKQTAYIATGSYGLAIVDVSQFNKPMLIGQIELPGDSVDVAVDSALGVALVVSRLGGIRFIDVSNPREPVLLRTIDRYASQVEVRDSIAYVTIGGGLTSYSVATGEELNRITIGAVITGLALDGSNAFVMGADNVLRAIEIKNGVMVARGTLAMPVGGGELSVGNGVAYIPAGSGFLSGFATANVSNPDSLTLLSGVDGENIASEVIVANGSGLALSVGWTSGPLGETFNALDVLDVSDPTQTNRFLGRYNFPAAPQAIVIASGIAFLAAGSEGLFAVIYQPFDTKTQSPTVNISLDASFVDVLPLEPGVQVLEGMSFPIVIASSDDVQVRSVELLVNGEIVSSTLSFPFNLSAKAPLLSLGAAVGQFTVQVRATDTGGNRTLSNVLTVQVRPDAFAPTIDQFELSPKDIDPSKSGIQVLKGTDIRIRFNAVDLGGLKSVELLLDGVVTQSISRRSGSFAFAAQLDVGESSRNIAIQIRATDRAGNVTTTQPQSLTIVPDTFAPKIKSMNLREGEIKPTGDFWLNIDFDEPMDPNKLQESSFSMEGPGGVLVAKGIQLIGTDSVTIRYQLITSGTYRFSINAANVTDQSGNPLDPILALLTFSAGPNMAAIFHDEKFGVGRSPSSVTKGDVNSDGHLDLVTANEGSGNVSVLLGRGDGTFAEQSVFWVGARPTAVVLGDVNKDGQIDLITSNSYSDDVSVLIGRGDGTFEAQRNFSTGRFPRSMAIGDVNGDDQLDIITANANSVSVLLGNGDGSFSIQDRFGVGISPTSVTTGDVNLDGQLDLITANYGSNDLSVLLGNGDGTFSRQEKFLVGSAPYSVTTGDLNSDGWLDLIAANSFGDEVSVIFSNGDGTFAEQIKLRLTSNAGSVRPMAVIASDANGDGRIDLITANNASNGVSILLNTGNGTFADSIEIGAGNDPVSVIMGDFNGDGRADLITANNGGGDLSVLLGYGDGKFANQTYELEGGPFAVATCDLNGDGFLDLATADYLNRWGNLGNITVLLGDGNGAFSQRKFYLAGRNPISILMTDANGDSKLDLLTANYNSNDVSVLLGNGDGTFSAQVKFEVGENPTSLSAGDVNGDGRTDLISANNGSDNVSVLLGNGDGTFVVENRFQVGSNPRSITTKDVNGDGKLDLITANAGTNNASVLLGNGDGTFRDQKQFGAGFVPNSVAADDLNRDGLVDLILANGNGNNVSVLLNNGDGTFAEQRQFGVGLRPVSVTIGDFNGDERLDIVTANSNGDSQLNGVGDLSLLLGNGDGSFAPQRKYGLGRGTTSVTRGDVNRDGRLDLIATNYNGSNISVLINQSEATGSPLIATRRVFEDSIQPQMLLKNQAQILISAAIKRWVALGVSADRFRQLDVKISDLTNNRLGYAIGNTIWLDDDAAGWGWFVDATPNLSEEFTDDGVEWVASSGDALQHIDLLTVIVHELGHILGLEDNDIKGNLMNRSLDIGTRRLRRS